MRVSDIMTRAVRTLDEGAPVTQASDLMRASGVRHLPVLNRAGTLVGVVSLGDVRQAALSSVSGRLVAFERRNHLAHAPVRQIMHQPVHVTSSDALLQDVASDMRRLHCACLPVVDGDQLVGIVTEVDLFRVIEHLPNDTLDATLAHDASRDSR